MVGTHGEGNPYLPRAGAEERTSAVIEVSNSVSSIVSGSAPTLGARRVSVEVRPRAYPAYRPASGVEGILVILVYNQTLSLLSVREEPTKIGVTCSSFCVGGRDSCPVGC